MQYKIEKATAFSYGVKKFLGKYIGAQYVLNKATLLVFAAASIWPKLVIISIFQFNRF